MTLLLGILAIATILGFWIAGIERSHRLAVQADLRALEHEHEALRQAHEVALDELDCHVEALIANAKYKHPTSRHLSVVGGEGA
jgi:Tfp pilus assembly protein PilE